MPFGSYSPTPSANTSIAGNNISEGGPPSAINNAIRQIMADARIFSDSIPATQAVAAQAIAASITLGIYPSTAASNVPRGLTQAGVGAITPGSGGTNGTFPIAFSGGNFSVQPTGTFTVAGGVLTAVTITGPGLYIGASATVPTVSLSASAGLTGASVVLTAQFLVASGIGYWVARAGAEYLDRYLNNAGVATIAPAIPSVYVGDSSSFGESDGFISLSAAMVDEGAAGENFFNPARIELNKLLPNGQSTTTTFGGGYVTPYIPVVPGSYIIWNFAGAGTDWGIQFYDLDRNFISTPGTNFAGVPVLIPAGVYYVRNSFFAGSAPVSEAMFAHGQTLPASYIPYGPVSRQADRRESLINARRMRGDNLNMLQSGRVILGQYVDLNGADAALSELSTAIIPVAGLATVTVSYGLASSLGYYFRTLDGKKIGITSGPTTSGQAITVPTDAAFLYYSVNTASLTARDYSARPVFLEGTVTLPQPMSAIPATVADTRPWFGKRFILQGDSRAAEKDWPGQLAADAGIKSLRNIAVGGRGLEGALLKEGNAPLVASDFTGIDALIMMIGLNGSGFVPIGSFSDPYPAPSASGSAMPANFIPRMRYAIEQYRFWNPLMRVLCFGNMQVFGGGASYNATGEAREAERQVCELHGVPRLDLWALNGITANNYARFMPDGIHPTVEGEKVAFLQPAKGFLQSNYPMLP